METIGQIQREMPLLAKELGSKRSYRRPISKADIESVIGHAEHRRDVDEAMKVRLG